jgi:hypothetical protein
VAAFILIISHAREGTSYHYNLYKIGRSKFEKELEFSSAVYATENLEEKSDNFFRRKMGTNQSHFLQ